MKETLIVAHRGDMKNAPENTLSAFEHAIAKGADIVELDVHLTQDNILVVHHDYYLGRTNEGTGYISDYTFAELRRLDVGEWFGEQFAGEKMPTFADVLDLGKGEVRFEIEIRTPTLQCLKQIADEIANAGVAQDVELTTPHIPLVPHIKRINPELAIGLFFQPFPNWMEISLGRTHIFEWTRLTEAQVVHLPLTLLDNHFIDKLHQHEIRVHAADLNTEDMLKAAMNMGADQISTDDLELALRVRNTLQILSDTTIH